MNTARKVFQLTIAVAVLALSNAFAATKNTNLTELTYPDSRWVVTYQGRFYDGANTTFSYSVAVTGDPALSHFTVGLGLCTPALTVVSFSPQQGVSIGLDPTTGVYGIKWDLGVEPGQTQNYSVTVAGNVAELKDSVAVKAGLFYMIGHLGAPSCSVVPVANKYDISGVVFVDANHNGVKDADEPILPNVSVILVDSSGNEYIQVTGSNGMFVFKEFPNGVYQLLSPAETTNVPNDFNEILYAYFHPSTSTSTTVTVAGANSEGNDFGFNPSILYILDDLNPGDPDMDGLTISGTGKTIGFWKHQLSVAIKGKGSAQVNAVTVQSYLDAVEMLYLPSPFQFNDTNEKQAAFDVLSMTSSVPVDLLKKQLLGTELNDVAGMGLSGVHEPLQDALIAWGEYLAAHGAEFSREDLLAAKDVFDMINNTGE